MQKCIGTYKSPSGGLPDGIFSHQFGYIFYGILNILLSFGIFVVIWLIFGKKSGNPDQQSRVLDQKVSFYTIKSTSAH
jgi:hypothetical protein